MNASLFQSRRLASLFVSILLVCFLLRIDCAGAQRTPREHLTPQEIELVRDTQELDRRIAVFIKAAERRLLAISNPQAAQSKQVQKDVEAWGELPKGTRAELLSDLAKILDEAITNIDDTATRNENNPLIPKAVRKLAEASSQFIAQLTPMRNSGLEDPARDALEEAVENAQAIIEAANKLPAEVKKNKGKTP